MTDAQKLKEEIERAASTLGIAPSTLGERIGQGGQFYSRLCKGHRVWPETAEKARARISALISSTACELSHGGASDVVQEAGRAS